MTIIIGTASSMPQTSHTQPQNRRPTKTATAFIREARLVSHGVSSRPSTLVIRSETPETNTAIRMLPNCISATAAVPAVTTNGPKYGIELNTPAAMPHTAACSTPIQRNASHVATATIVLVNTSTKRNIAI